MARSSRGGRRMGELHFVICHDCQYTGWLEGHELANFINDHSGHRLAAFSYGDLEDKVAFGRCFRRFMGWPVDKGAEDK